MSALTDPNIASPAHKANPYPFYSRLRAESPVHQVKLPDGQTAWLISRYADAVAAFRDERLVKNKFNALTPGQVKKQPWMPAIFRPLTQNMLDLDPPDHTRLRALVQKAFTPRLVEQMRPRIESLAQELLDKIRGKSEFDLIHSFALPIPTTIIAEMLGIPVEDQERFHRWSTAIVTANSSAWGMIFAIPAIWKFLRYIRRLIVRRKEAPQADLISKLIEVEEAGGKLSEDELVAMIFLLLVAGHETTVNLIANGVLALLDHPEQLQRIRKDHMLLESAVEEMLRYASPLETATERYAREEVEVAGVCIPQGALVFIAIASANRDEAEFPNADVFDITRSTNRHISFGLGPHYCLGAPLARLEAQIAIRHLLSWTESMTLAIPRNRLSWRKGLVLRGLTSLPIRYEQNEAWQLAWSPNTRCDL
jgi:cytochrome P450